MKSTTVELMTVAKKRGRPKSENPRGEGPQVRLDPDLVAKAKMIALRRQTTVSEYLNAVLEAPIARDYRRLLAELTDEEGAR
jgi:hypothetical protein